MYLTKVGVTKENAPYIDFEKVASDLLMISVEIPISCAMATAAAALYILKSPGRLT